MSLYEDYSPAADKWLHMDGSVTTMAGEAVLPADSERAALYETMSPNVAKWLLPDGSVVSDLPCSGGDGTDGGVEKRPTLYNAVCSTSGGTAGKVLTGLPEGYEPQAGDFVIVKFSLGNSAINCIFTISGVNYAIKFNGLNTKTIASGWKESSAFLFYYDGAAFHQLGSGRDTDDNTTYTGFFDQFIRNFVINVNSERALLGWTLVLERTDSTFDAALKNTSQTANKNKPVNTGTDFKVNGLIWFNNITSSINAGGLAQTSNTSDQVQVQGYHQSTIVDYALNGADHLKKYSWVYLVGIPQENPMVYRLDPDSFTSWYTTTEPTTENEKIYIRLGRYDHTYEPATRTFFLFADHPAYWFKDGSFRPYLTRGETPAPDSYGGRPISAEPRATLYKAACDTAGDVNIKDLTELPGDYEPVQGDMITVRFANGNSAANCAFTITGGVAQYQIKFNGLATNTTSSAWKTGGVFQFFFDGTEFHQLSYAN